MRRVFSKIVVPRREFTFLFHSHYFPATSARYNTPYTRSERGHAAWRSEFSLWRRSVCWASCCCPPQTNRRKPYPWPSVQTAPQRTTRPQPGQLLFPELSDTDITGIRIHANDDCEFDFSVRGELSVNGQKADEEVFSTLVDQLTADSFTLCDDFEPQNDALLTVTVYTDTQDFSASFYQEQGDDKYAYVVAGADNERFLKTDAWRVGTLLLTCEGTRIFDASGQETPVD